MHPANDRRRYNVTSSLIGWTHKLILDYIFVYFSNSINVVYCSLQYTGIDAASYSTTLKIVPNQWLISSGINIDMMLHYLTMELVST